MASLKKCIEQHCKNCSYDKAIEGTWRAQVESCTVQTCALWPVRPLTMETIIANRKVIDIVASLEDEDDGDDESKSSNELMAA
jgi:hypothetical protein